MALLVAARAVPLPLLSACWVCVRGDGTPASRGPRTLAPLGPPFLDRPGLAAPRRFAPPPARRLHIWVTFGYGMCCGCLRYDTGPVSAALRPREPASLLCAIKRLSLLSGWINYLPYFQLRDPYSRFVDSSQHLIQIFVMLARFSIDKLFLRWSWAGKHDILGVPVHKAAFHWYVHGVSVNDS